EHQDIALVEPRCQLAAPNAGAVAETVVGLEDGVRALRQDDLRARDPIGLLAVDEVAHDVEGTERARTFVGAAPALVDAREERPQHRWRAAQDVDALAEVEGHRVSRAWSKDAPARGGIRVADATTVHVGRAGASAARRGDLRRGLQRIHPAL